MALQNLLLVLLAINLLQPSSSLISTPDFNPRYSNPRAISVCSPASHCSSLAGAKVRVECKDKNNMALRYSKEGTTDSTGTYRITVVEDHLDQICDSILVSSPQNSCSEATPGRDRDRDRARVILTGYNGIASYNRFANAMGFMKTEALSSCGQILKEMQELDV